jgi:hypothetical protein
LAGSAAAAPLVCSAASCFNWFSLINIFLSSF